MLYPLAAMVLLTAFVLVSMFRARVRSVREKRVPISHYALPEGIMEPEYVRKAQRHFGNLFEVPVLFYTGAVAAMALNRVDEVLLALAWCYVIARCIHAAIHLGANRLGNRMRIYMLSWVVLLGFWGWLVAGDRCAAEAGRA